MLMFKFKKNKKGYTLIELVVYVGLSSIILITTGTIATTLIEQRERSSIRNDIDLQGNRMVNEMTRAIRDATEIAAPIQGATGTTLTLTRDSVAVNPTTFLWNGTELSIIEGVNPAVDLHPTNMEVRNLKFQNTTATGTPGIVSFQFDVLFPALEGQAKKNYAPTFYGSAALRK